MPEHVEIYVLSLEKVTEEFKNHASRDFPPLEAWLFSLLGPSSACLTDETSSVLSPNTQTT